MNLSWEAASIALSVIGLLCKIAWSASKLVTETKGLRLDFSRARRQLSKHRKELNQHKTRLDGHETRIGTLEHEKPY